VPSVPDSIALTSGGIAVSRDHSRPMFGVLLCLSLGTVALLGGCGGSGTSSAVTVASAREYSEGVRQLEENNKKHLLAASAARKAAAASRTARARRK
jgi:hypothetical protein